MSDIHPITPPASTASARPIADAAATLAAEGRDGVLAVVVDTVGSTYRKRGALVLLDARGVRAGTLSGGCLEPELEACARAVLASGRAGEVRFDTREDGDRVFGSGTGCRGHMHVLLLPLPAPSSPLREALIDACTRGAWLSLSFVLQGEALGSGEARSGVGVLAFDSAGRACRPGVADGERIGITLAPPPRLLLLGAAPATRALLTIARLLGWYVEIVEHRARWATYIEGNPPDRLHDMGPDGVPALLGERHFDAAVVMTHNFDLDARHLGHLAGAGIGYIGLLGPPERRDQLLTELGDIIATRLEPRLYAPIGLRLGGEGPEAIALAVAAQLQHYLTHDAHAD